MQSSFSGGNPYWDIFPPTGTVSTTPLRIAHIDDDADLRAMVRMALRLTAPCTLVSCASGEIAQQLVPSFSPDVILVDMMMPGGMDGIATMQALGKTMDLSAVSVVFASGTDDPVHWQKFQEAGAAAVIHKPFDAFRLAAQLAKIRSA